MTQPSQDAKPSSDPQMDALVEVYKKIELEKVQVQQMMSQLERAEEEQQQRDEAQQQQQQRRLQQIEAREKGLHEQKQVLEAFHVKRMEELVQAATLLQQREKRVVFEAQRLKQQHELLQQRTRERELSLEQENERLRSELALCRDQLGRLGLSGTSSSSLPLSSAGPSHLRRHAGKGRGAAEEPRVVHVNGLV